MGGMGRGLGEVVDGGGVVRVLVWVLLMLARLIESSMVPLVRPLGSLISASSEDEGSRIWRRCSLSARPSCQPALAHQPTTSSLMLSKVSFCFIMSRTQ